MLFIFLYLNQLDILQRKQVWETIFVFIEGKQSMCRLFF